MASRVAVSTCYTTAAEVSYCIVNLGEYMLRDFTSEMLDSNMKSRDVTGRREAT